MQVALIRIVTFRDKNLELGYPNEFNENAMVNPLNLNHPYSINCAHIQSIRSGFV